MPSLTPPEDPGRLTISVVPVTPARPRDSIAAGTPAATPAALIASAIPGARLRVIRGAAHLANVSSSAEFSAVLLGHLTA